jgi:hypothetical protein
MPGPSRILFDASRRDDISLVRDIVLRRLRKEPQWNVLATTDEGFNRYLEFSSYAERARFDELLQQVAWELVVSGILAPGSNFHYLSAGFPNFRVSDYGRKVLSSERAIPQDPDSYLSEIRTSGTNCVDAVAFSYIEEALCCFARGCYTSSVLLLGVAAEAVILKVCDLIV